MDNPKQAAGRAKPGTHCIPPSIIVAIGIAMEEGAIKYGPYNWRKAGIFASDYYDATMRHLHAHWEGESRDPDSGLPHLLKAIASLIVWLDAHENEKVKDDRPTCHSEPDWFRDSTHSRDRLLHKLKSHESNS